MCFARLVTISLKTLIQSIEILHRYETLPQGSLLQCLISTSDPSQPTAVAPTAVLQYRLRNC